MDNDQFQTAPVTLEDVRVALRGGGFMTGNDLVDALEAGVHIRSTLKHLTRRDLYCIALAKWSVERCFAHGTGGDWRAEPNTVLTRYEYKDAASGLHVLASARPSSPVNLGFGVDIWSPANGKVFNFEFDPHGGGFDIVSFTSGDWEDTIKAWGWAHV